MKRLLLAVSLAFLVGCAVEKDEVPPITDAERLKQEQQKNAQMMKETGEARIGKTP